VFFSICCIALARIVFVGIVLFGDCSIAGIGSGNRDEARHSVVFEAELTKDESSIFSGVGSFEHAASASADTPMANFFINKNYVIL
jgi:hypothetical protein